MLWVERIPRSLRLLRAERLRDARKRFYEKAVEAADALGVPRPTYHGHENGSRGFAGSPEANLYAEKFDVSLDWLLGKPDAPEPKPTGGPKTYVVVEKIKKLPPDKMGVVAEFLDFVAKSKKQ